MDVRPERTAGENRQHLTWHNDHVSWYDGIVFVYFCV